MNQPWDPKRIPSPAQLNQGSYYSQRRRTKPDARKLRKGRIEPSKETLRLKRSQPLSEWSHLGEANRLAAADRLAEIAGRGEQHINYRFFVVEGELSYPSDDIWFIQINDKEDSFKREWDGCVSLISGLQVMGSMTFYANLVHDLFTGDYTKDDVDANIAHSFAQEEIEMHLSLEKGVDKWQVVMQTAGGPFVITKSCHDHESPNHGIFALSLCQTILSMQGLQVACKGQRVFDPVQHFELLSTLVAR